MLTNEQADEESKAAEICRLKERVQLPDTDTGAIFIAHACVDELTAESKWRTTSIEKANVECDALPDCIREL